MNSNEGITDENEQQSPDEDNQNKTDTSPGKKTINAMIEPYQCQMNVIPPQRPIHQSTLLPFLEIHFDAHLSPFGLYFYPLRPNPGFSLVGELLLDIHPPQGG